MSFHQNKVIFQTIKSFNIENIANSLKLKMLAIAKMKILTLRSKFFNIVEKSKENKNHFLLTEF